VILMWVFWLTTVQATTLSPLVNERFAQAVAAEKVGDFSTAAAQYGMVLAVAPHYEQAVMGLGRSLQARGDVSGALAAYERLHSDPEAIEARAVLLEGSDPQASAALYRLLQTLLLGDEWPYLGEARALTDTDSMTAAAAVDNYLDLIDTVPKGPTILDVLGALRRDDQDERAETLMLRLLNNWPQSDWAPEVQARLDRLLIERFAQDFVVSEPEPLSDAHRTVLTEARLSAAQGNTDHALDLLRSLLRDAPRSAEAWGTLGEVHSQLGQVADAEQSYRWALAIEPAEAVWHERFGQLLTVRYGGKRDREARDSLRTARALRPSWAAVAFELAEVERSLRDYDSALTAYQDYLKMDPKGSWSAAARQRVADLSRLAPPTIETAAVDDTPAEVPDDAIEQYRLARAYRSRDDLLAAETAIVAVLEMAPDWTAAINLSAAISLARGDSQKALVSWQRSLLTNPNQAQVWLAIGELHRQEGRLGEAESALEGAAQRGVADALYLLADMAFASGDFDSAERILVRFFELSTGGTRYAPALALQDQVVDALHRQNVLIWGVSSFFVLGMMFVGARRIRSQPLSALLEQAPGSAHDVAMVVSAVRHELLKHNTTLLEELADALRCGDIDAVSYGVRRLYGDEGALGVVARFDGYVRQLRSLGRRHGVLLDLRNKDPLFAPMSGAMRKLRRLESKLHRPPKRSAARFEVAEQLVAVGQALNEDAYHSLGVFMQQLGTVYLSAGALLEVETRVREEPAFTHLELPKLNIQMGSEHVPVRVFQGDLDDIVANLLRNAYQAVAVNSPDNERRVGLSVIEQADPITGLATVELRFQDTAEGLLTDAMLHGRSIGRGLGLTVDLVTRHEGTIHVEPDPGWSKAIVVSLQRVESSDTPVAVLAEE
jgi:tetratricopeptide (TPR) repeat protein